MTVTVVRDSYRPLTDRFQTLGAHQRVTEITARFSLAFYTRFKRAAHFILEIHSSWLTS